MENKKKPLQEDRVGVPEAGTVRRVVRLKKRIPTHTELISEARERNMTVPEYVEYLSSLNRRLKKSEK